MSRRARCAVRGCTSSWKNIKMISFPPDKKRYDEWVAFTQNPNLGKSKFICALHFETKCFHGYDRKNRLLRGAMPVPTLKGPSDEPIGKDDYLDDFVNEVIISDTPFTVESIKQEPVDDELSSKDTPADASNEEEKIPDYNKRIYVLVYK